MDFYEKYHFILEDEKIHSSPAYHEAYTNYRNRGNYDPLDIFAEVIGKGISDAFLYAALSKSIEKALKEAIVKSGGTWTN